MLAQQFNEWGGSLSNADRWLAYHLGLLFYQAEDLASLESCESAWKTIAPGEKVEEYKDWQLSHSATLAGNRAAVELYGYDPGVPENASIILDLYRPCLPPALRQLESVDSWINQLGLRDLCDELDIRVPDALANNASPLAKALVNKPGPDRLPSGAPECPT